MRLTIAIALSLAASPAIAQQMNAEAFHQRATKLQKKGALALFSRGEIKALMTEVQEAGRIARERRLAAVRAGEKPRYCPPENAPNMNSDEYVRRLSAIPRSERARITMTEATIRILADKYPC